MDVLVGFPGLNAGPVRCIFGDGKSILVDENGDLPLCENIDGEIFIKAKPYEMRIIKPTDSQMQLIGY